MSVTSFNNCRGIPLSVAYPQSYGGIYPRNFNIPVTFRAFMEKASFYNNPELAKNLHQNAQAIGAILDLKGNVIANAILVTPRTAIVPVHAFGGEKGSISFPVLGKTFIAKEIYDGSVENLDFKLVELPELNIKPALLSTGSNCGISLQFSYDAGEELYVTPFKSQDSQVTAQ